MRLSIDEGNRDDVSKVFEALGDSTRRDLIARLSTGDATVGELAEPYQMTLQAVSKHIKVLEEAGVVSKSKNGQQRTVHLEANVFHLMKKWIERYQRQAEQRYERLDAVLAEMNTPKAVGAPTATKPTRTRSAS